MTDHQPKAWALEIMSEHLKKAGSAVMATHFFKAQSYIKVTQGRHTWMVKGVSFFLLIALSSIVSGTDRLIILLKEKQLKKAGF